MEEEFILKLREMVAQVSRETAREVVREELPGILKKMAEPGDGLSDLIDYDTAAAMLGISKGTIHNYINNGKLAKHTFRDGGKPYLSRSEIMKLLKSNRRIKPSLN